MLEHLHTCMFVIYSCRRLRSGQHSRQSWVRYYGNCQHSRKIGYDITEMLSIRDKTGYNNTKWPTFATKLGAILRKWSAFAKNWVGYYGNAKRDVPQNLKHTLISCLKYDDHCISFILHKRCHPCRRGSNPHSR